MGRNRGWAFSLALFALLKEQVPAGKVEPVLHVFSKDVDQQSLVEMVTQRSLDMTLGSNIEVLKYCSSYEESGDKELAHRCLVEHYNALGSLAERVSDHGKLLASLQLISRAVNADPLDAETTFQFAITLESAGMLAQAAAAYERALELRPDIFAAFVNLGSLLHRIGDLKRSRVVLLKGIELFPFNPALHNNLAVLMQHVGDNSLAEFHWRKAIEYDQECIPARASLGNMLIDQNQLDEAAMHLSFAAASADNGGNHDLALAIRIKQLLGLERVYTSLSQIDAIRRRYEENLFNAVEIASRRLNQLHATSSTFGVDMLAETTTDVGYYFVYLGFPNKDVRETQALLFRTLEDDPLIPHFNHSDSEQTICFSSVSQGQISCKCKAHPRIGAVKGRVQSTSGSGVTEWNVSLMAFFGARPRTIGIFSEFYAEHSVSKLFKNTLRFLNPSGQSRWKIILFQPSNSRKDNFFDDLMDVIDEVVPIPLTSSVFQNNVKAARSIIQARKLDALVFPEIGMGSLTYFVALHRNAPVQIAFWGHPVTTGMHGSIDYFISSKIFERNWSPLHHGPKYTENLWMMNGLTTSFPALQLPPLGSRLTVRKELLGGQDWISNANVYLCPQTLYKFHPLMDRAFAEILERDPKSILLIIRAKQQKWNELITYRITENVKLLRPNIHWDFPRILAINQLKRDNFLRLLGSVADVVLDTFPFGGGVSHLEAIAVAAPVIVYQHSIPWIPQYAPGIYEYIFQALAKANPGMHGELNHLPPLLTKSVDNYISSAINVATNPSSRSRLSIIIREATVAAEIFQPSHPASPTKTTAQVQSEWNSFLACALSRSEKVEL